MPKSNYNKLESYRDLPCELEDRAENALISERQVAIRKSNKLIRDFTANMTTSHSTKQKLITVMCGMSG